jgi:phenylalanyl-tRNA synthetase beta chain
MQGNWLKDSRRQCMDLRMRHTFTGTHLMQTSEAEMLRKELGDDRAAASASQEIIYKIDIPANRYDMLCLEGISRALNVFRRTTPPPTYTALNPQKAGRPMEKMIVEKETALIRPFVVAAVLRGVAFDRASYESFIDLQDKLHQNLCRQRSLVAIGTHDLDTLKV